MKICSIFYLQAPNLVPKMGHIRSAPSSTRVSRQDNTVVLF